MVSSDWILFGDGHVGLYYDEKNITTNREGIKIRPILVAPEEDIIDKYSLEEEDLPILTDDNKKARWMEYPDNNVIKLRTSKGTSVFIILCAFDGSETVLTKYYSVLLKKDEENDREIFQLRAHIASLNVRCDNLASNVVEGIRKDKEIIDAIKEENTSEDED